LKNLNFSNDSSLDCSLENDESNVLTQNSCNQISTGKSASNLNLDKPFVMDLSVQLGANSNRSSIISQVSIFFKFLLVL
jgi:hypothetical protein